MDKKSFEIMLLDVISCKWTHTLLTLIADDVIRPGEIQSRVEGLSIKVMNESLMRLVSYKMLTKGVFNEVPPRVEYRLTSLGKAALKLRAVKRGLRYLALSLFERMFFQSLLFHNLLCTNCIAGIITTTIIGTIITLVIKLLSATLSGARYGSKK